MREFKNKKQLNNSRMIIDLLNDHPRFCGDDKLRFISWLPSFFQPQLYLFQLRCIP